MGKIQLPLESVPDGDDTARQVAKEMQKQLAQERRTRRGNLQGCGCILIAIGIVCMFLMPPLAIIGLVGVVVLIVGLFA